MIHIDLIPSCFENAETVNFWITQWLCRIAVPFYFTAAGFLLFRKIDIKTGDKNKIKVYCFKILRLLGIWIVILKSGQTGHLWYLGSLVFAVLTAYMMLRYVKKTIYIVFLALAFYAFGMICQNYMGILDFLYSYFLPRAAFKSYFFVFQTGRNGLCFGLIFVLMGAMFAKRKIVMSNKTALIGFAASMLVLFAERYLVKAVSPTVNLDMMISLIPAVFFLFYFASHIGLKDRPIYKKMRASGMIIYFMHLMLNVYVSRIVNVLSEKTNMGFDHYIFFFTAAVATAAAFLIEWLSRKKYFKWLRFIYS